MQLKTGLLLFLLPIAALAQPSNPAIVMVTSAPTGACTNALPDQQVVSTGVLYSCQGGTWAVVGGGGGGGPYLPTAGGTMTGQIVTDGLGSDILVPAGGSITVTNDGVHPNSLALPWNSTTNAAPTNATGWQGAVSASGTAGWFDLPSALPSTQSLMLFAAVGSGHSVGSTSATLPNTMLPAQVTTVSSGSISVTANNAYVICTTTCTVTPVAPAAGIQLCVRNAPGSATVITMAALGGGNYYELTTHAAWGTANHTTVSGGAYTDSLCLVGYDANHYAVMSYTGTWTD